MQQKGLLQPISLVIILSLLGLKFYNFITFLGKYLYLNGNKCSSFCVYSYSVKREIINFMILSSNFQHIILFSSQKQPVFTEILFKKNCILLINTISKSFINQSVLFSDLTLNCSTIH